MTQIHADDYRIYKLLIRQKNPRGAGRGDQDDRLEGWPYFTTIAVNG